MSSAPGSTPELSQTLPHLPPDVERREESVASAVQPNAVIHTDGLTKHFGDEVAVQDVSLDIERGVIFGFIGPSGSGKTTTVRLLTGIAQPSSGALEVFGVRPDTFAPSLRKRIGYMPQLFVLYPDLSVWENMNFVASLYGLGFRRGKRMRELLDFVELTEHRHKLARKLSGGMQRRLSLAATLIHDPDVLFLDEPTAGIDPVLRAKFWDYFRELRSRGRTLFVTTQYVGEAAYCDRIGVMRDGRLLAVETPTGLRRLALGGEIVDVRLRSHLTGEQEMRLRTLPFVREDLRILGHLHLRVVVEDASAAIPQLLRWFEENQIGVEAVDEYQPPFDDVFVELIRREDVHA